MKKYILISLLFILLLSSGYLIINLHNEVEDQVIEQLLVKQEIYAKQASKSIESFFDNYKNSLSFLSKSKQIILNDKELQNELKNFYETHQSEIEAITRISKDGIIIGTYPLVDGVVGRDVSFQKHNAEIIKTQKPTVSDVLLTVQGYRAIVFAYPVLKGTEYNGCISLVIRFDYIAEKFLKVIKIGESGYATVISESGIELYCNLEKHIGKSIFPAMRENPGMEKMVAEMLKGEQGRSQYSYRFDEDPSSQYTEMFAVFYPVDLGNTFWSISVTVAKNEVLAINRSFVLNLIIITAVVGMLILVFLYIYFKSREKSKKIIRKGEEKYRVVTEQTGQLIYEYFVETGEITWGGAIERITGYTESEFSEFKFDDCMEFIHPDDKVLQFKLLKEALENSGRYKGEYRSRLKNGKYIYFENNGVVLKDKNSNQIRMIGTMRDINEKKETEKILLKYQEDLEELVKVRTSELNEANKSLLEDIERREKVENELNNAIERIEKSEKIKTEFLAQMSHEIRTPVNTILSFSNLMREQLAKYASEELRYGFIGMNSAGIRIIRTIDLILNMSELQTDTYEYKPKSVDVFKDVITKLKTEYYRQAIEKGLEFTITGIDENTKIIADEYTVFQIFANLIDNAIKYTPKGKIEIIFKNENNENLTISVSDTGIGMSKEYLPNLFTSFSQEEGGYTRKFEGNGLGLALVKKYCEMNKAEINVTSKKHEGSTFTVSFPLNGNISSSLT
jgi:PAS domain S-box-containing protein